MKLLGVAILFVLFLVAASMLLLGTSPTALVSSGGCGEGCACLEEYAPPIASVPASMVAGALLVEGAILAAGLTLLLALRTLRRPPSGAVPVENPRGARPSPSSA